MSDVDAIVLGAGIVGVSTAIHLHQRGLSVALVDRGYPGEETSSGNAGIVASNGFCPAPMPSTAALWLDTVLKQSTALTYDFTTVIRLIPWLRLYFQSLGSKGLLEHARAMAPLRSMALEAHLSLSRLANAERFFRRNGWLQVYRSDKSFSTGERERHFARIYGVDYQTFSAGRVSEIEPALKAPDLSGVFWPDCIAVTNPAVLTESLWRYFIQAGGIYLNGDAGNLQRKRNKWHLNTARGYLTAGTAVVALGPWSGDFAEKMGERFPLAYGRGYCLQFRPNSGATLSRPVTDMDHGYTLSPMERGIRLTSGVEVAARDEAPNPVQLLQSRRRVEDFFPLGSATTKEPLMATRACLPDFLPVVGPSAQHRDLWYNFGHGGSGFTLGPVCGRLLADRIAGRGEDAILRPLSPMRFLG